MWLSFQMRYTKKVSMWPVGLITKYGVSSPIVRNGSISGFYDGWIGGRKFPVDMAGFAVNVNFLLSRPNASMPYKPGYEEDGFLKSLSPLNLTEIELMATNCTQVWKHLNWKFSRLSWHILSNPKLDELIINLTSFLFTIQILVWHTQSKKNPNAMALDMGKYNNTNLVHLKQILV